MPAPDDEKLLKILKMTLLRMYVSWPHPLTSFSDSTVEQGAEKNYRVTIRLPMLLISCGHLNVSWFFPVLAFVRCPRRSHVLYHQFPGWFPLPFAIAVSSGIPDFRSKNGLYQMLKSMDDELDDPQQMFDLEFFKENPHVF